MELPWGLESTTRGVHYEFSLAAGEPEVILSGKEKVTSAEFIELAQGDVLVCATSGLARF